MLKLTRKYYKENVPLLESPVRALFTSRSGSGAWRIRGEQLANTRTNWRAINKPSKSDIQNSDVVCVIKKPDFTVIDAAKKMGKPVVFDIVDAWAQPRDDIKIQNGKQARDLFRALFDQVDADSYIFATETMRRDLAELVRSGVTIYHHYFPEYEVQPFQEKVRAVGYIGREIYLGEWSQIISNACEQFGIKFKILPKNVGEVDLMISVRGGEYASYLAQNYKSNVKTANAYGSAIPMLAHINEMSAHDTDHGDIFFFRNEESLKRQISLLIDEKNLRLEIRKQYIRYRQAYSVQAIAMEFEGLFAMLAARRA